MKSQIPLPTDNIYKFYALFGLFLFISAITLAVINNNAHNEKLYQFAKEDAVNERDLDEDHSQKLTGILKRRTEIQVSDKKFILNCLTVVASFGVALMILGFTVWQIKIQPQQDKLAQLQIEKLEQEIEQLKNS